MHIVVASNPVQIERLAPVCRSGPRRSERLGAVLSDPVMDIAGNDGGDILCGIPAAVLEWQHDDRLTAVLRGIGDGTRCRRCTLWEEVTFDNNAVTSVDWLTYPILDITETPEKIDFALINLPELPASGAGEPSIRPVAAAIANAIFDATGVRIRRVPFSPERVKQALS